LQEMISRADEQLLFAKRAGKSRARVAFDQDRNASNVA
jgi:PleD family two-component response regulator